MSENNYTLPKYLKGAGALSSGLGLVLPLLSKGRTGTLVGRGALTGGGLLYLLGTHLQPEDKHRGLGYLLGSAATLGGAGLLLNAFRQSGRASKPAVEELAKYVELNLRPTSEEYYPVFLHRNLTKGWRKRAKSIARMAAGPKTKDVKITVDAFDALRKAKGATPEDMAKAVEYLRKKYRLANPPEWWDRMAGTSASMEWLAQELARKRAREVATKLRPMVKEVLTGKKTLKDLRQYRRQLEREFNQRHFFKLAQALVEAQAHRLPKPGNPAPTPRTVGQPPTGQAIKAVVETGPKVGKVVRSKTVVSTTPSSPSLRASMSLGPSKPKAPSVPKPRAKVSVWLAAAALGLV